MSFFGDETHRHMWPSGERLRSLGRAVLMLGMSFLVFFPLLPSMPSSELDSSWKMALNVAWARSFEFPRAMVFTFGPYAFLATWQYHPDTYTALALSSVFLGAVLFMLLRHVDLGPKRGSRVYFILICLVASGYTNSPDVRFLCFPFLLLVAAAQLAHSEAGDRDGAPPFGAPVVLYLTAFSLGMICLVKATYAVDIGVVGILSMTALYATGRRFMAAAIFMSFAFGLTVFWLIAGQSLADLPRFFFDQAQLATGYVDAMASGYGLPDFYFKHFPQLAPHLEAMPGLSLLPLLLFLLSMIPLAIAIKRNLRAPTVGKCAVVIGMAVILFISFKEGFIRDDPWHAMTAPEVLLILPWCWPDDRAEFWRRAQTRTAVVLVTLFMVLYPHALDLRAKADDLGHLLYCSNRGPIVCPFQSDWLEKTYQLSLARIRAHARLPKVNGTVDVYTIRQSLAIANGFRWDPRPIPQSYSAYTPALARMNAEHLLGAKAPNGVLFALEPIDGRLPTLADGPSWPILLTRYHVSWLGNLERPSGPVPIAYLVHNAVSQRIEVTRTLLLAGTAQLGQRVYLPPSSHVLFAKIDLHPNAIGSLAKVLFRLPLLYINFVFPGGRVQRYRFIPGMARSGFVISPLVSNAIEFTALQNLKVRQSSWARRPIAFWITVKNDSRLMWNDAVTIQISRLRELHE